MSPGGSRGDCDPSLTPECILEEPSEPATEAKGKMVPTYAEAPRMDCSGKTLTSVLTTPKSYPALGY